MMEHGGYSYYAPPMSDEDLERELQKMLEEEEWVILEKELLDNDSNKKKAEKYAAAVIKGNQEDL